MVDFNFDKRFENPIVGIDEVGRGSLAGPVTASAVLLNFDKPIPKNLDDSKKTSSKMRLDIYKSLKKYTYYGIGEASNDEIDTYGIVKATFSAMERSLLNLMSKIHNKKLSTLLIDGTQKPNFKDTFGADTKLIKKGDALSPSIAAASIFAKCNRDALMIKMADVYEGYGFSKNMGYGTKLHKTKLHISGPTQFHRMTFSPMKFMK